MRSTISYDLELHDRRALKLRKEVIWQLAMLIVGIGSIAGKDSGLPTLAGPMLPPPQPRADPALVICVSLEGKSTHSKYSISAKSVSDSE